MIRLLKAVVVGFAIAAAGISSAQQIQVQVDGNAVYFPYAQPQYMNGRVLVPLRGIFEQLGAVVTWSRSTQNVSATKGDTDVELHIGSHVATVNGSPVNLDVPPMVMDGTTMVPIRFISEALGAQVGWLEAQQLVSIATVSNQNAVVVSPPRRLHRIAIRANEVIPVTLDTSLSSVDNQRGDGFSATVHTGYAADYAGIPQGTTVEGHIAAVHPRQGDRPGILDLAFDRIRLPDGRTAAVDGTLISLDNRHVQTNSDGLLTARNDAGTQDQRMVYAGYGAGGGLLVGVLTKRPLEDTVLGGALGYIFGQVQHDQRRASNVTLSPGTRMGIRINHDLVARW
ncbi:MAG: copper amine oxidase N-terminal domain-containing protein [Fimbriimonadales bacterium]